MSASNKLFALLQRLEGTDFSSFEAEITELMDLSEDLASENQELLAALHSLEHEMRALEDVYAKIPDAMVKMATEPAQG